MNNLVGDVKTNPKDFYRYINSQKKDAQGIPPLKKRNGGGVAQSESEKAAEFNGQFTDVFTKSKYSQVPLMDRSAPFMEDIVVTKEEVTKLFKGLNPSKALGPDELHPIVLKELATELGPIFTHLFQQSIDSGDIPKEWTLANISPLFKKGDRSLACNYRPVSLTCVPCKLLEHIVCSNIMAHLDEHKLLSDKQHAFRKWHSCETQLATVINDWAKILDNKGQVDTFILDFEKAFDTPPHELLKSKLFSYGIGGKTLKWINAFLCYRQQRVVVNGVKSDWAPVVSGVPQGTGLGPLLFSLHINGITANIESEIRLFADDCVCFREIKDKEDTLKLQRDIDRLGNWARKWGMRFQPVKCNMMQLTNKHLNKIQDSYTLEGTVLENVDNIKYLGVTITNDLKWNTHISNICTKANRTLGFLRRTLFSCPQNVEEAAYKGMVRPIYEYGSSVWDPHPDKLQEELEKVQNRAARFVTRNYVYETGSMTGILGQLKWESLKKRRKDNRLILLYKGLKGKARIPTDELIPKTRRGRNQHSLAFQIPSASKDVYQYKKLFSFLKSAKQDQTVSPPLQKGNRLVTDKTEKANTHNQQFQSVFTTKAPLSLSRLCKMQIQDMTDNGTMCHDAVPAGVLSSSPKMEEFSISINGILKLLQNLKPFKAAGPDRLKPLLLKELRDEIAPIIQIIFERSIQTGKLPADWSRAQVTPIFKKGNKSSAANYRPISLTCILCKVLEHIMASHVVKHLNSHDLLYDLQHGFREKRSCETQLTMLVEDLARNMSSGKQTDLVLLDFSKAFDKVNHSKLLWKLHQYGIRGTALAWIRAFLGNRSQTVVLEGEESGSVPVTSGVPQGSVLGPILFLVYINDLLDELSSQVRLFADDTAVYLTIGGADDGKVLQNDLDRLSVWEDRWDMEFNPSKCQVVQVTSSKNLINTAYTLHGQILEVVACAKYLGVDISSGLSWNTHIDRITGTATRTLNFIQRNIRTKNEKVRETAYNTLVRPQLEYASPVWDPHHKEKILQLEKVQRRAARWTTSSFDYWSSVTAIVNDLGWRTLEQRRADARLCLFFKMVYGLVAVPLPDYIEQSNRISRYCHSMTFRQLHTSKDYYKHSFFPLAIVQWNALPETVACLPDLESFKVAVSKLQHTRP